jgi:GNAT superfamily N-acetyltransferase
MMTRKEIIDIAYKQLSIDYHSDINDFYSEKNVLTKRKMHPNQRKDLWQSCVFNMMSIQGKSVVSSKKELFSWIEKEILPKQANWIFDFYMLRKIDQKLKSIDYEIDQVLLHYLPDPERLKLDSRFDEAFCFDPDAPDVLGVAYLNQNEIVGMAGVSRDSNYLYQMGVNIDEKYRHQGIGTMLVSQLTSRLLNMGIVPFYKTSISHVNSSNVAIKSGFFLAWVEVTSKKIK